MVKSLTLAALNLLMYINFQHEVESVLFPCYEVQGVFNIGMCVREKYIPRSTSNCLSFLGELFP